MSETAKPVSLLPDTVAGFDSYIATAELAMQPCFSGMDSSLWSDLKPEVLQSIREEKIAAQFWSGKGPVHVANGLIHDWVGAAFAPGVSVAATLALLQDYDHHKDVYKPEVIDSRLVSREGNDFQILLRLRKKKIVTVVLDTFHAVHYNEISPTRWTCRSITTSIREVEHAGTSKEVCFPPDTGYGYMWRLNSYWNLEERDAGVWMECRAISLSRDIPKALAWIIEPIIRKLPRESLIHTLEATRQALTREKTPEVPAVQNA